MGTLDLRRAHHQDALAVYSDAGFLIVPDLFSEREVACVARGFPSVTLNPSPKVIRETNGDIRSVFLEAGDCRAVDVFVRQWRLISMAEAVVGSQVYAYQVKINIKKGLSGDVWPWHQDYVFWREKDGLQSPRVLTVGVLLDEATEFNGPMLFVPGSHRQGMLRAHRSAESTSDYANDLAADLSFVLKGDVMGPLVEKSGIVSAKGKVGTTILFDANVVHSSANNLSPSDRKILFVTYCSVDNGLDLSPPRRPNFLANRDRAPLEPLPEDAFLSLF